MELINFDSNFKGGGSKNDITKYRYIHTKDDIPKLFGHIVISSAKNTIMSNMSKYQIAKPGHRCQEHTFVIKSVIALYELLKKPLILQLMDLTKYFDRESLKDCMSELYKCNIRGKLYRLLYQLNKNTEIQVKTPVGMTGRRQTGEGVGQGTMEGLLSLLQTWTEDVMNSSIEASMK